MRFVFFLFVFGILAINAEAQHRTLVKAIVVDSTTRLPVPLATVSILRLRDTTLLSYTTTDNNGVFTLSNFKEEPSVLLISHVGYSSLHVDIDFSKNNNIDLGQLYLKGKMLQEVIVRGARIPVIIKKDTIEFDAEAFKTRPNAVVEDLLKKLPGVQVDYNGHITVNGKPISKIQVNGEDFFAVDPKIATKNLDADMIAKIQVYDDWENDPNHLQPEYEVKKIINLKFKKIFNKGSLSKLAAGAGSRKRYDANVFYSLFEKDLQIAANVNSNNLSGTGIFSDDSRVSTIYGGQSSIVKSTSGTIHFNDTFGKAFKLNGDYQYLKQTTDNNSTGRLQQFIGDTIFSTTSTNNQHQAQNSQTIAIITEWKPDSTTLVKYEPIFVYNYTNHNNIASNIGNTNFLPLLSNNTINDHGNSTDIQFHHNISYYHTLHKKSASVNISHILDIHPQNGRNFTNSDLLSYVAALQSDTLHRLAKTTDRNNSEVLNIELHYLLTPKISTNIGVSSAHDSNAGDLLTYKQDVKTGLYDVFLQDQSSGIERTTWRQLFNPTITWQITPQKSLNVGLSSQWQQIRNHFQNNTPDLSQYLFYFLPSVDLRLNQVTISYRSDIMQPSINDLQPIAIVYNQLFTFIGNPALKTTKAHRWGVNYFNYSSQSKLFFNMASNVTVESNTIIRKRSISAEGAEISMPVNRNGKYSINVNVSAGKDFQKLNKWQIHATTGANIIADHNFFEVNGSDGYQNTTGATITQEIRANWNDMLEIRSAYNLNYSITKYQSVDLKDNVYTMQKASLGVDFFLPKNYSWGVQDAYSYNPLVAPGFKQHSNLLSLSAAKRIQKKGKGELRITCYDLLNQSINAMHFASENTINDMQYQSIKRYVLLTYTYRFNDFGK